MKPYQFLALLFAILRPAQPHGWMSLGQLVFITGALFYESWLFFRQGWIEINSAEVAVPDDICTHQWTNEGGYKVCGMCGERSYQINNPPPRHE